MKSLPLEELALIAEQRLEDVEDGAALSAVNRSLIEFAAASSVTSLSRDGIAAAIDRALGAGASPAQLQEMLSLVAGLGVHSLMIASPMIADAAAREAGAFHEDFDHQRQLLWDQYVGDDPTWTTIERLMPGFLTSMLWLSPAQFEAFFNFCSVPWRSRHVSQVTKELAAIACDASPSHRFLPGFLLHLDMAVAKGAGRLAIIETLEIAARSPVHRGTR